MDGEPGQLMGPSPRYRHCLLSLHSRSVASPGSMQPSRLVPAWPRELLAMPCAAAAAAAPSTPTRSPATAGDEQSPDLPGESQLCVLRLPPAGSGSAIAFALPAPEAENRALLAAGWLQPPGCRGFGGGPSLPPSLPPAQLRLPRCVLAWCCAKRRLTGRLREKAARTATSAPGSGPRVRLLKGLRCPNPIAFQ